MENYSGNIVSKMIFTKDEAGFVLKSFEFAMKEKKVDLESKDNRELKLIHLKLRCMHNMADEIAEIRGIECELLNIHDQMVEDHLKHQNMFQTEEK
jgi:hypothetical protein